MEELRQRALARLEEHGEYGYAMGLRDPADPELSGYLEDAAYALRSSCPAATEADFDLADEIDEALTAAGFELTR